MADKYVIVKNLLSAEEAAQLKEYLRDYINRGTQDGLVKTYVMHNRPDTWDPWGYIERGSDKTDDYFRSNCSRGMLEPTRYFAREFQEGAEVEPFVERATGRDAEVHNVYRKIGILVLTDDYEGGETVFTEYGESLKPAAGDLIMYEADENNKVGLTKITSGSRYEVVFWYSEMVMQTRFDEFYMPPMEDQSDRFNVG